MAHVSVLNRPVRDAEALSGRRTGPAPHGPRNYQCTRALVLRASLMYPSSLIFPKKAILPAPAEVTQPQPPALAPPSSSFKVRPSNALVQHTQPQRARKERGRAGPAPPGGRKRAGAGLGEAGRLARPGCVCSGLLGRVCSGLLGRVR